MKKLLSFLLCLGLTVVLAACGSKEETISIGRELTDNGDTFLDVVVVLAGEEIIAVSIDEYQFGSGYKSVPNKIGESDNKVVFSKLENNDAYSEKMKNAGSTQSIKASFNGIEDFAVGKTVKELEEFLSDNKDKEGADLVSGSTLNSTDRYVQAIINSGKTVSKFGEVALDKEDITIGRVKATPHGESTFADVVVVLSGDTIIAASIDEYQFGEGYVSVPGDVAKSDKGVLYSKRVNNDQYSENMKKANATQSFYTSIEAIQSYAFGKTVSDLEDFLNDHGDKAGADLISGSTLNDTLGYLNSIIQAAKNAK